MGQSELTPLQADLEPEELLDRGFFEVARLARALTGVELLSLVKSRFDAVQNGDTFTMLDMFAGSGRAANQIANIIRRKRDISRKGVRSIALDVNPVPHLAEDCELPFVDVDSVTDVSPGEVGVQVVANDATNMEGVPDNCVDVGWSVGGLAYVPDVLEVLNETMRVLRPGGSFYHICADVPLCRPRLRTVLVAAGAMDSFRTTALNRHRAVACMKLAQGPPIEFHYPMTGEESLNLSDALPWQQHYRRGVYDLFGA